MIPSSAFSSSLLSSSVCSYSSISSSSLPISFIAIRHFHFPSSDALSSSLLPSSRFPFSSSFPPSLPFSSPSLFHFPFPSRSFHSFRSPVSEFIWKISSTLISKQIGNAISDTIINGVKKRDFMRYVINDGKNKFIYKNGKYSFPIMVNNIFSEWNENNKNKNDKNNIPNDSQKNSNKYPNANETATNHNFHSHPDAHKYSYGNTQYTHLHPKLHFWRYFCLVFFLTWCYLRHEEKLEKRRKNMDIVKRNEEKMDDEKISLSVMDGKSELSGNGKEGENGNEVINDLVICVSDDSNGESIDPFLLPSNTLFCPHCHSHSSRPLFIVNNKNIAPATFPFRTSGKYPDSNTMYQEDVAMSVGDNIFVDGNTLISQPWIEKKGKKKEKDENSLMSIQTFYDELVQSFSVFDLKDMKDKKLSVIGSECTECKEIHLVHMRIQENSDSKKF